MLEQSGQRTVGGRSTEGSSATDNVHTSPVAANSDTVSQEEAAPLRSLRSRLRCCPPPFYQSCRQAQLACRRCSAGLGPPLGQLYYDGELHPHPYAATLATLQQERRERAQRSRQALQLERRLTAKLGRQLARQTQASGAVRHDGDAQLLGGYVQVDYKLRRGQNFVLNYDDYQKGLRQGTNAWYLTLERPEGRAELVCLTPQLFQELLARAELATRRTGQNPAEPLPECLPDAGAQTQG